MDIKDFRTRKLQFEYDLAVAINKVLLDFEKETSYTPSRIEVNMVSSGCFGKASFNDYTLESVTTEIKL